MMSKRKINIILLIIIIALLFTSCNNVTAFKKDLKPQVNQMRSICELATMECYYHNVAKFDEKDAEVFLFWKKDKKFWIEYSGIVKIGIDASLVSLVVNESTVTVTIPEAKVIGYKVDDKSFTDKSFIFAQDSAKVTAEDQTKAFAKAQEHMVKTASSDTALLSSAQQRAQSLIEDYIKNIGQVIGKEYVIDWKYIKNTGAN